MTTALKCEGDLFCGVNTVEDTERATDLEKKHLPIINAPEKVKQGETFEVTVQVGALMTHPNEYSHYIEFIELYADETYLARMDFTPKTTNPVMKVEVQLDHIHEKLRAYARCNLHGTWEGDFEITVEQ